MKERLIEEIKGIEGVKTVSSEGVLNQMVNLIGQEEKLDKNGIDYIRTSYKYFKISNVESYIENKYYYLNTVVSERNMDGIESLKAIVVEGSIDKKEIQEEPTCILVKNYNEENVTKYKVGDKIKLSSSMMELRNGTWYVPGEIELTVSSILDEDRYSNVNPNLNLSPQVNMVVIVSDSVGEKYLKSKMYSYKNLNIQLEDSSYYEEVNLKLSRIVNENTKLELIGKNQSIEKDTQVIMLSIVVTYSLPTSLTICSILNLFSIMSMNIVLRKKEFAMFRAIGMSNKEIKKLISIEAFLYGLEGLKFGVIVGTILVGMLYIAIRGAGIDSSYPVKEVVMIIVATLLVCLGAAANSWRIVLKDDIISSIRATE